MERPGEPRADGRRERELEQRADERGHERRDGSARQQIAHGDDHERYGEGGRDHEAP